MNRLDPPRTAPSVDDPGFTAVLDFEYDHHVHVVLSGLIGGTKATVGHMVANELGRPFVDCDSLVRFRSGRARPVLEDEPEARRELASAVVDDVLSMYDAVVFAAPDELVGVSALRRPSSWLVWLGGDELAPADVVIEIDRLSSKEVAGSICEAWRAELRRRAVGRHPSARPLGLRGR